jgi:hypothetical protein
MLGYGKTILLDLSGIREVLSSMETELQSWLKNIPEVAAEKESAEVLVLVFVVEKIREVRK